MISWSIFWLWYSTNLTILILLLKALTHFVSWTVRKAWLKLLLTHTDCVTLGKALNLIPSLLFPHPQLSQKHYTVQSSLYQWKHRSSLPQNTNGKYFLEHCICRMLFIIKAQTVFWWNYTIYFIFSSSGVVSQHFSDSEPVLTMSTVTEHYHLDIHFSKQTNWSHGSELRYWNRSSSTH